MRLVNSRRKGGKEERGKAGQNLKRCGDDVYTFFSTASRNLDVGLHR